MCFDLKTFVIPIHKFDLNNLLNCTSSVVGAQIRDVQGHKYPEIV